MVKNMCDNIHQVELLTIQSSDFLVPVNVLKQEKYVLDKLDSNSYHIVRNFNGAKFIGNACKPFRTNFCGMNV